MDYFRCERLIDEILFEFDLEETIPNLMKRIWLQFNATLLWLGTKSAEQFEYDPS